MSKPASPATCSSPFLCRCAGLISNEVSSIAVDDKNRKRVGYEDAGVGMLTADNLVWFHETAPKLSHDSVGDIAVSPDGAIWVGTYLDNTPQASLAGFSFQAQDEIDRAGATRIYGGRTTAALSAAAIGAACKLGVTITGETATTLV